MNYPAIPNPTPSSGYPASGYPASGYPANGGQWTAQQAQAYAWKQIPWIKSRVQPLYDAAQAFRDFAKTVQTVIDQGDGYVKNDLGSWVGDGRDAFVRNWARNFSGDTGNWYTGLPKNRTVTTEVDAEEPPANMLLILKNGSEDAADQMESLANAVGSLLFTELILQVIDVVLTVVMVLVPIAGVFGKIGEMIFMKGVEELSVQAAKEVAVQFIKTSITAALKNLSEMVAKNLALQLLKGFVVGAGIDIGFQIFNQNAFNLIYSSMMGQAPPPLQANINPVEVIESGLVGAAAEGLTHVAMPKINALTKNSEFWQSGAGQRAINASLAIGTGLSTDAGLQGVNIAAGWQKGWNWEESAQNAVIGAITGFHPPHAPPPDAFSVRQDHPGGYTKTWQFTSEQGGALNVIDPRTGHSIGTGHWNDGAIDVTYKNGHFEKITLAGSHIDRLSHGTQTVQIVDPKTGKPADVQVPTKTLTTYGVDGAGNQHLERQATYYSNGTAEIRDQHGIYQTQHRLDQPITVDRTTGKIIQYDGKSGTLDEGGRHATLDPSVVQLPEGSVITVNDQGIVTSVLRPTGGHTVDLYALGPDGHLDRIGILRHNGDGLVTMTDDPGHRTTVETKDATYSAAETPVDRTGRGVPTSEYQVPTGHETGTMWEQPDNPLFTLHKGQVTPAVPATREEAQSTPVSELPSTRQDGHADSSSPMPAEQPHGAETPHAAPDLAAAQSLSNVLGSAHPGWTRGAVDALANVAPGGQETFRMPVRGGQDSVTVTVTRDATTKTATLTLDPEESAGMLDQGRLRPGVEPSLRQIADVTGMSFRVEIAGGEAGPYEFGFHPGEQAYAFHQILESLSPTVLSGGGGPVRTTVDLGDGTRVSFTPRVVSEPGRRETIRLTDLEVEGGTLSEHDAANRMRSLVTDVADALGRRVEVVRGDGPGVLGENLLLSYIPDLPPRTGSIVPPAAAEFFPPVESGAPPTLPAPVPQPSSVPEFGRGEVAEYVAAVYQTGGEIQRFSFPIEHEGTSALIDVTGDVDTRTGEVTLRLAPGENAEGLRGRIPREVVVAQAEEALRGIRERLPGPLTVHNGELDVVLNPPDVAPLPGEGGVYGVHVEDMRAIHGAAVLPNGDKRVTVNVPPDVTTDNAAYKISWTTRYVLGEDGEARLVLHEPMVETTLPDGTRTYGPLESLTETERSEVFGPIQRLLEQVSGKPVDVVGTDSARVQPETMKVAEIGATSGKPEQAVPKIAESPEETAVKVPLPAKKAEPVTIEPVPNASPANDEDYVRLHGESAALENENRELNRQVEAVQSEAEARKAAANAQYEAAHQARLEEIAQQAAEQQKKIDDGVAAAHEQADKKIKDAEVDYAQAVKKAEEDHAEAMKPRVLTQAEPDGNNVPDYPQAEMFSKNNGLKPRSPNVTRPLNPYGPVEPLPRGEEFGPNNLPPGDVYPELPWAAPGQVVVVSGVEPSAVLRPESAAFERLWKALWHLNLDTHLEHNVVELEDGSFHIVQAGKYALLGDGSLAIKRIWMHVHPHWLPPTGPSFGDLRFLGVSPGQKAAILIEQGLHPYEYEVPDAVRAVLGLPPSGSSIDIGPRITALRDLLAVPDEEMVVRLPGLVEALANDSSRLPPDAARGSLIGDIKDIAADFVDAPAPGLRKALQERLDLLEHQARGGTASPLADAPPPGSGSGDAVHHPDARTFATNAEATKYGEDTWADARKQLPREEKNAVQDYAAADYSKINDGLRKGAPPSKTVLRIDRALSVKPTPEAVHVFRSVDEDAFTRPIEQLPGTADEVKGYTSTELVASPKFASYKKVLLHLEVEAGTPAMYLGDVLGNPGERELLLGRNLRIRYDSVELINHAWGERWHVHATIGPADTEPHGPNAGGQVMEVSERNVNPRGGVRTQRLSEDMLMRNLDGSPEKGLKNSNGELIGPVKPTTPPREVPVVPPNFAERAGQAVVSINPADVQVLGDHDLATGARIERTHTPGGVDLTPAELEMYARRLIEQRMYHPETYPGEGGALLVRPATATEPAAVVLVDNPGSSLVRVPEGWVALMHYHPYGHVPGDRPSSGDVLAARNTSLDYLYVIHHASTDTGERAMIVRITREAPADGHNWPNDPIWDLKSPGVAPEYAEALRARQQLSESRAAFAEAHGAVEDLFESPAPAGVESREVVGKLLDAVSGVLAHGHDPEAATALTGLTERLKAATARETPTAAQVRELHAIVGEARRLAQAVGAGAEFRVAMADPARIATAEDARDYVGWLVHGEGPQRIVNAAGEDRGVFQAGMQSIGLLHERLIGRLRNVLQHAAGLLIQHPEHADLARSVNDHLTHWDDVEFAIDSTYVSRMEPPGQPVAPVSPEDAALVRRLHDDLVRWNDVYAELRKSSAISAEGSTPQSDNESQVLETAFGPQGQRGDVPPGLRKVQLVPAAERTPPVPLPTEPGGLAKPLPDTTERLYDAAVEKLGTELPTTGHTTAVYNERGVPADQVANNAARFLEQVRAAFGRGTRIFGEFSGADLHTPTPRGDVNGRSAHGPIDGLRDRQELSGRMRTLRGLITGADRMAATYREIHQEHTRLLTAIERAQHAGIIDPDALRQIRETAATTRDVLDRLRTGGGTVEEALKTLQRLLGDLDHAPASATGGPNAARLNDALRQTRRLVEDLTKAGPDALSADQVDRAVRQAYDTVHHTLDAVDNTGTVMEHTARLQEALARAEKHFSALGRRLSAMEAVGRVARASRHGQEAGRLHVEIQRIRERNPSLERVRAVLEYAKSFDAAETAAVKQLSDTWRQVTGGDGPQVPSRKQAELIGRTALGREHRSDLVAKAGEWWHEQPSAYREAIENGTSDAMRAAGFDQPDIDTVLGRLPLHEYQRAHPEVRLTSAEQIAASIQAVKAELKELRATATVLDGEQRLENIRSTHALEQRLDRLRADERALDRRITVEGMYLTQHAKRWQVAGTLDGLEHALTEVGTAFRGASNLLGGSGFDRKTVTRVNELLTSAAAETGKLRDTIDLINIGENHRGGGSSVEATLSYAREFANRLGRTIGEEIQPAIEEWLGAHHDGDTALARHTREELDRIIVRADKQLSDYAVLREDHAAKLATSLTENASADVTAIARALGEPSTTGHDVWDVSAARKQVDGLPAADRFSGTRAIDTYAALERSMREVLTAGEQVRDGLGGPGDHGPALRRLHEAAGLAHEIRAMVENEWPKRFRAWAEEQAGDPDSAAAHAAGRQLDALSHDLENKTARLDKIRDALNDDTRYGVEQSIEDVRRQTTMVHDDAIEAAADLKDSLDVLTRRLDASGAVGRMPARTHVALIELRAVADEATSNAGRLTTMTHGLRRLAEGYVVKGGRRPNGLFGLAADRLPAFAMDAAGHTEMASLRAYQATEALREVTQRLDAALDAIHDAETAPPDRQQAAWRHVDAAITTLREATDRLDKAVMPGGVAAEAAYGRAAGAITRALSGRTDLTSAYTRAINAADRLTLPADLSPDRIVRAAERRGAYDGAGPAPADVLNRLNATSGYGRTIADLEVQARQAADLRIQALAEQPSSPHFDPAKLAEQGHPDAEIVSERYLPSGPTRLHGWPAPTKENFGTHWTSRLVTDPVGVLKAVTAASRREVEPLSVVERVIKYQGETYLTRTTVQKVKEDRGSLLFPYGRDTSEDKLAWSSGPYLDANGRLHMPGPNDRNDSFTWHIVPGRADLAFSPLKYRMRYTTYTPQQSHSWTETVTETTRMPPESTVYDGTAATWRTVYKGDVSYEHTLRMGAEVKQMLRSYAELKVYLLPRPGKGLTFLPDAPHIAVRLALEKTLTSGPALDQLPAIRSVRDLLEYLGAGREKDKLESELYFSLRVPLLGDDVIGLPFIGSYIADFAQVRGFQFWWNWKDYGGLHQSVAHLLERVHANVPLLNRFHLPAHTPEVRAPRALPLNPPEALGKGQRWLIDPRHAAIENAERAYLFPDRQVVDPPDAARAALNRAVDALHTDIKAVRELVAGGKPGLISVDASALTPRIVRRTAEVTRAALADGTVDEAGAARLRQLAKRADEITTDLRGWHAPDARTRLHTELGKVLDQLGTLMPAKEPRHSPLQRLIKPTMPKTRLLPEPQTRSLPEQHPPVSAGPAPEAHLPAPVEDIESNIATRQQHLVTVTKRLADLGNSPLTRVHESMEFVRRLTRTYQGHLDAADAKLAEFRATALRMPVHGPLGRDDLLRFRQESLDRLSGAALGDVEEVARLERLVDRARRVVTLSPEMTAAVDDLFKDFADPAALPEAQRRMAEDVRQSVIDAVKVHEYLRRHGIEGLAEGGAEALRTDRLSSLPDVERTVHELRSELHRLDTAPPPGGAADALETRRQEVAARLEAALTERDRLDRVGRRYLQSHPDLLPVEESVLRTRISGLEAALAEAMSRGGGPAAATILDDLGRAGDQLRWIETRRATTDLRSHIDEVRAQADAARRAGDTVRVTELESRLGELERALGSLRSVPEALRPVEYALERLAGIDVGQAAMEGEHGKALHRLITKLWKVHDEGHVALDPEDLRKAAAGNDDALAALLDRVRRAGEPETILTQAGVHGPVEYSPEPVRPLPIDPRSRTVRAALADSRKAAPKLWKHDHLERQAAKLETTDPVKAARLRAKMAALSLRIKGLLGPVEPLAEKVIADETGARPDVAFVQAAIDAAPNLHPLWSGDVIDVASRHVDEAYQPVESERVNLGWQRHQDETYIQTRGEAQRLDATDGRQLFRHMTQVMGGGRKGLFGDYRAETLGDPRSWQGVTTTDLDVPVNRKVHLTHREIIKDWLTGKQPWPDPIGGILPVDSKILHSRHTVVTPNGVELKVEVYRHQSLIIDSGRVTEGGLSMLRIDGGLGDGILPFWHMPKLVDVPIELGPITLKVSVPVGPNLDLQYIPGLRRDFHLYDQVGRETIITRYGPGPRDFWVYETPASELRLAGDVFQTEQFYTKWGVQLATFPMVQVAATVPGVPPSARPALFQFGGVGLIQVTGEFSLFFDPHTGHFLQPDWTVGAEALTGLFVSVPDVIDGVRIHPDLHGFLGWGPSPGTVPWNRVLTFDLKPWIEHYGQRLLLKVPGVRNAIHERLAAAEQAAVSAAEAKVAEEARIGGLLDSLKDPSHVSPQGGAGTQGLSEDTVPRDLGGTRLPQVPASRPNSTVAGRLDPGSGTGRVPQPPPVVETPPKVADVLRDEMRSLVTDAGKRVPAAVESGVIGPKEKTKIDALVDQVRQLAGGSGAISGEVLQRHAPQIRELRSWLRRLPAPATPAAPASEAHTPGGTAGEVRSQAPFRVPPRPRPSAPGDTEGGTPVRPGALPRRVVLQPAPPGAWSRPLRERPRQELPAHHTALPQNPPRPRKLRLMPITPSADEPHLSSDEPESGNK